jgi:hypothetical protein
MTVNKHIMIHVMIHMVIHLMIRMVIHLVKVPARLERSSEALIITS